MTNAARNTETRKLNKMSLDQFGEVKGKYNKSVKPVGVWKGH